MQGSLSLQTPDPHFSPSDRNSGGKIMQNSLIPMVIETTGRGERAYDI